MEFFRDKAAYKGFRCPLKSFDQTRPFVPDFTNRYFTVDNPLGVCLYKGVAELTGTPTPTMDMIILWAQQYTRKQTCQSAYCDEQLSKAKAKERTLGRCQQDDVKIDQAIARLAQLKQKRFWSQSSQH